MPPPELTPGERNDLLTLLSRADTEEPSEADLSELRQYLNRFPELRHQVGSLAAIASDRLITLTTTRPFVYQAIVHVAQDLRHKLTRPGDTAVEHLIIEQCIIAHMLHYTLHMQYLELTGDPDTPLQDLAFWEKRLTVSQHRFLRALESLARVRNLAIPLMQINIAKEQTNIMKKLE